ncbi:SRPBCC domain-containing protein [Streptomyces sp. ISL-11]|uniref:SRPBCC domain-containing protein n=1 Tax=Streptomyces sp. ISL-11 TaxID=2819174 RepID=UPI001BE989A6|nr:SRPBCC domain-containing protein [Streptomyces sp. ISL-11]MBT2384426.1 SRPBCC domain-containing protein [Streptomyces sp. ISL-11]
METPSPYGTSEIHDGTHTLRYTLSLPYPVEEVWAAVATPEVLPAWLAAADPLEPRRDGAVTLRWLNTDERGHSTVAPGKVTAWEPFRVAEYTVDIHGRVRFELEPAAGGGTVLRFTNEVPGADSVRLDCLAGWHVHFEYLREALAGRPADWSAWTLDRWRELRREYERREPAG